MQEQDITMTLVLQKLAIIFKGIELTQKNFIDNNELIFKNFFSFAFIHNWMRQGFNQSHAIIVWQFRPNL